MNSMLKLTRRNFVYALWMLLSAVAFSGCVDPVKAVFKKPRGKRKPMRRENPYVADGKSLVAVVGGEDVKSMVQEAVSLLGGFGKIGIRNRTVLVKPNVVSSSKNPTTTNPEVVKAVVSLLYQEGASKVYVGDMSALRTLPTSKNMNKTGSEKRLRKQAPGCCIWRNTITRRSLFRKHGISRKSRYPTGYTK